MSAPANTRIDFRRNARRALADPFLQAALKRTSGHFRGGRDRAVAATPNWESLRDRAHATKTVVLENLDAYLVEFTRNLEAAGGRVHRAAAAADACRIIDSILTAAGAKRIVKSKSMVSEEIELNPHLEARGYSVVETDLGEFIIQLAGETPSHIIAPAVHKSKQQVVDLFRKFSVIPPRSDGSDRSASAPSESIEALTAAARARLRSEFLQADAGISGANFLVAETGHIVIVENEGNARLTTTCPRLHIAVAGIEKVLPKFEDLWVFLTLLPRSATGQMITTYVSLLRGPRAAGELDGPEEFHLILLDNGRSHMRHDPLLRQTLMCIRCGACLNFCPVYQTVGGHAYGGVYSGPIGAITTPQMRGLDSAGQLPYASSLCSACADVCPVKIPIPEILLRLRSDRVAHKSTPAERLAFRFWRWAMTNPGAYDFASRLTRIGARLLPFMRTPGTPRGVVEVNLPLAGDWLKTRDLPPVPARRFRDLWKKL